MFPWPQYIPYILPPYLFDWIDVTGDGNCGFRAITVTEMGGEDKWPLLRRGMSLEMETHREQYARLYLSPRVVEEHIYRVGRHSHGPARFEHWMESQNLYAAATFLNIAIAYYGAPDCGTHYNFLVLPLRRTGGTRSVNKLIHILWVNHNHYVQLLMNDDTSPLPPIQQNWRAAADVTCVELARHFQSRISLWTSMVGRERQQGNNTADDAVNLDSP
jgi:hypothetical protein